MTRKAKIAVTLPPELVTATRQAVREGRAGSVSAYVAEALRHQLELDELDGLLEEMLTETGGPLSRADRRRIDRELGWAPST